MTNGNLNNNQYQPAGNKPEGETFGVPPPKAPEVKIRTMESDVESVKNTGGGLPEAETLKPSELREAGPVFKPETVAPESPKNGVEEVSPPTPVKKGGAAWLWWLVIIILVITLGVVVYYYAAPFFAGPSLPAEPAPTAPAEQTPPAETQAPKAHLSLFGFGSGQISQLNVSDYSVLSFLTALQSEASNSLPAGEVKEVALYVNGDLATTGDYLLTFLPELSGTDLESALRSSFGQDFTAYLYYDDSGVWPGYVFRLDPNTDLDAVTLSARLSALENASVSNFYLSPAGDHQPFKSGPVGDAYVSRYASFPQKPASLNYGMFNGYLVISTTYNGLLAAVDLLGI